MKILIADDDAVTRKVLKKHLEVYGDCDLAPNGQIALDLFQQSHDERKPYDLVFLDIMMPEMLGSEVLDKIRKIEEEVGIEVGYGADVVMSSSLKDTDTVLSAFVKGCEYFLVKPINKDRIHEVIAEMGYLKKKE